MNGKCKCGANHKCTAALGKPFCGKTGTPATAAAASDDDTATCYVREYFLRIHFQANNFNIDFIESFVHDNAVFHVIFSVK